MEKLINLKDLLHHEILDLYSAEEQIIEALPAMIDKATNTQLKAALSDHLEVTKRQKERLDKIRKVMTGEDPTIGNKSFFSKLFGSSVVKCKGIEGLLQDAQILMDADLEDATMDAAIIGAAQKVEHYEIAGYGTCRAYAKQLNMDFISAELGKTLGEEHDADKSLSSLAVGINISSEVMSNGINDETGTSDHSKPGVDHFATSPIVAVIN